MRIVTLGEVCKVVSGSTPKRERAEYWGGTIPWVTPKEINRLTSPYLWGSEENITEEGFNSCSTSMLPVGSILLSSRAPIGLLAINKIPVCTNQGFKSLVPSNEVNAEYLYYVLKANVKALQARGNGATFKELAKPAVENFEIPLPPIDDQLRIAHLLAKVEGLIAQRKQNLQHLDDLLNSVFLEMFGDPVRNEKGWDKPALTAFGKISTGNTPLRSESANYDGDFIEWIKTDNIKGDVVCVTTSTEYLSEIGARKARTVTSGALLVACIAGSVESIGRAALTDRTVSFNQQINAIQPGIDVNPLYLYGLFKLSRGYIQSHATKGMKKILTKGDFEKITMIKPPFEMQNQFAVIVEKVEGIKSRYKQSLTDMESLYGAISQQAFKGELDLSRVPLPKLSTQHISPVPIGDQATVPEPVVQSASRIHLPDNGNLLAALENSEARKALMAEWLEAYRRQLGNAPFSAQDFMVAVSDRLTEWLQTVVEDEAVADEQKNRLAEFYTSNDVGLYVNDYEHIKKWVFEALAAGALTQGDNKVDNRIELKAVQS
ncbi:restriction endonuclease subunit S [Acinetobacter pittii]|uniref:Restriction endonuclease subunit S n=1 Tax=Acinetobacter pittii TaxID=48296 RepID=A0AAE8GA96_ACIPI|nr:MULTISPECIES: restriction endonuclease subunit S [Acinetobacter calcoaceticus/baumannii complex]KKZ42777.1 restriction endonuclease subunit S [Acinetobacter baumannii]RZH27636.1 restriction endonuclease subunit S [Acinetobacter pittii]